MRSAIVRTFIITFFALALILIANASAIASSSAEDYAKVISYNELVSLSSAARAHYLLGLREAIVELEIEQRSRAQSFNDTKGKSARLLFLKTFIEKAEAAEPGFKAADSKLWAATFKNGYNCPPSVTKNPSMIEALRKTGGTLQCESPLEKPSTCHFGYKWIGRVGRQNVCVLPLPHNLYLKHLKSIGLASKPHPKKVASAEKYEPLRQHATAPQLKERSNRSPPGAASEVAEAVTRLDPDNDHDDRTRASAQFDVSKETFSQFDEKEDSSLQTCALPKKPDAKKCSAETISAARVKYYSDKTTPHCLYGGNLSHFKNSLKQAGNCQPQHEFCVNRLTCKNYDGSDDKTAVKNFFCKPNEIICNPYVFNTSADNKTPLCVKPGPNATTECAVLAKEADPDGKQISFMLRAKSEKPIQGIIEGWNEFADEINKMCFSSPAQDVYCNECQILKSRLFNLNLIVRNPNNAQHDVCGILKRFDSGVGVAPRPPESRPASAPADK